MYVRISAFSTNILRIIIHTGSLFRVNTSNSKDFCFVLLWIHKVRSREWSYKMVCALFLSLCRHINNKGIERNNRNKVKTEGEKGTHTQEKNNRAKRMSIGTAVFMCTTLSSARFIIPPVFFLLYVCFYHIDPIRINWKCFVVNNCLSFYSVSSSHKSEICSK